MGTSTEKYPILGTIRNKGSPPIMAYRNNKENHMILNVKWVGTLILVVLSD